MQEKFQPNVAEFLNLVALRVEEEIMKRTPALPGAAALLILHDGEEATFQVTDFEVGWIKALYPGETEERLKVVLRVYVPEEFKEVVPYYWDIPQKRLITHLYPILKAPDFTKKLFQIRARGVPPALTFSVKVTPIS